MNRPLRRLFLWSTVLLTVLTTSGCCSTPPDSRPSRPFERASSSESFEYALPINPYELPEAELGRALDLVQSAGANAVVSGASWWYIEPESSPESHRWRPLDRLVDEAQRRGLKVKLQVNGTPDWVHPDLEESASDSYLRIWHPPREHEELKSFAGFVRTLVERYGRRVDSYEIWNEPNHDEFWRPSPDTAEYAALLRAAYMAAKDVDPQTTIVFGGLSRNDVGYLEAYYSEAKKYPDAASEGYFFDVMDVHPYSSIPPFPIFGRLQEPISPDRYTSYAVFNGAYGEVDQNFLGIEKIKFAMDDQGDLGKPIYLGEYGFSISDTWMEAVPDYRRAFFLKRAYALARTLPYVEGMSWYSYVPSSSAGEEWEIVDKNLVPSMTYHALAQTTGAEKAKVAVTLPEPQKPVSGAYAMKPDIAGLDETDASGWELFVDGKLIGSYDKVPFEWDTRQEEDGIHHLVVAMYTNDGSVWASDPGSLEVRNGHCQVKGRDLMYSGLSVMSRPLGELVSRLP